MGHIVGNRKIKLDPKRIESIISLPAPRDKKAVKRFVGMAQFCRNFVPGLNVHLSPLFNLLKNNTPFIWDVNCQKAFNYVKNLLSTAPILRTPSLHEEFILETDASNNGVGVCLKFIDKASKKEHVIGYGSHKFTESELNWDITEKECFAIIYALRHYRHFLLGTKFKIKVDNRVVGYLKSKNDLKSRKLLNWAMELNEYDYQIIHIPSKNNQMSDCLSRVTSIQSDDIIGGVSLRDLLREQHADKEE